ncbi:MAG TPA: alpha/beta hydrolase [Dongiaceae bacterium]|nr:alpha/beta hydrolase [Dongiaceae bacterium]
MNVHSVIGGGGVKLHVREWGQADAPAILFIHGWSQNHMCWHRQYESQLADAFRLVAFDLRGHGMSEAPAAAEQYTEPQPWADDIAAIIDQLNLEHPVLVGWSYAGFVICDYVRAYSQDAIAGINFVGAAVTLDTAAFGVLIGPGLIDHVPGATADDVPSNIRAMRAFVRGCTAQPLPRDEYEMALCWNVMVPPKVRAALVARVIDSDDVLKTLDRPVLVTHGQSDTVVLPAMGERILKTCRTSAAAWYPGIGHAPFLEDSPRFNSELADFVRKARASEQKKRRHLA